MAFDLHRALLEGLGSRIPFLDRLLSYCYFADMSVLEVASCDSGGRGVSLVGRMGAEGAEEVVLVSPLPSQASRRGILEDPLDRRRALRLLAATWALASLQDPERPSPGAGLIAVHPDPDGDALSGLARERDLLRPRRFLLLDDAPRPGKVPVAMDGMIVRVAAPLPVQSIPRPLRDIQVWRWHPGPGLFRALEEICSLHREGRIVPLLVHPRSGILLEEPPDAEVTVGLLDSGVVPPPAWRHVDSPMRIGTQGSWGGRVRAFAEGFSILSEAARRAWGGSLPDGAIRVVGTVARNPVGIDLVIWVPAGSLEKTREFLEQSPPKEGSEISLGPGRSIRTVSPASLPDLRFPPGMALCIPEGVPTEALGSRRDEEGDPVREAVTLAMDLKELLRGLLRPGQEGR